MMNYLISAYSVNPYKGSEDSIGWNWVLQYEKNYKEGDRIILLTKKFLMSLMHLTGLEKSIPLFIICIIFYGSIGHGFGLNIQESVLM